MNNQMDSSSNDKKKNRTNMRRKIVTFLLIFVFIFVVTLAPFQSTKAQMATVDAPTTALTIWQKIEQFLAKLWKKGASLAFQQVLRTALNKIAYDTANYLGSGGEGQQPLFVTQDWGAYLGQVGDEAAGEFLEAFSQNLSESASSDAGVKERCNRNYDKCKSDCIGSDGTDGECLNNCTEAEKACMNGLGGNFNSPAFNVCQPSSLDVKLKISLGLSDVQRPNAPNCTATQMVQDWGDAAKKYTDFEDPQFLNKFKGIFDPRANDLGIYFLARTDMSQKKAEVDATTKVDLTANKGWLQQVGIGKESKALPSQAEREADQAGDTYSRNFGQSTGDAFVDAANIFLNQLAMSGFSTLMQKIGQKSPSNNSGANNSTVGNSNYQNDPNVLFGEVALKEVTSSIIKPNFGVRADYDILAELAICMDKNNPGPVHCVMDNKLMQGITEKKTVAEAITDGYLYGDWQLTEDTREDAYSLRNISIMRKYRILPIGWEVLIKKAYEDQQNIKKITLMDAVSCFDPNDDYNQFSSDFDPRNQGWCQGLIDPNWVLKAPLNYCKKQGVSAQLLNKTVIPGQKGTAGVANVLSSLNVTRADNYCADNQTCIKEKSDGSCEVYGYCNEEERIWKFNSDTCEPIYNTCQTFVSSNNGKTTSYLENTLDYGDCNADNSGCKAYSFSGTFATTTNTVSWNENKTINFNKNITGCSSGQGGCTELIRVRPAWGTNLVMDSSFSQEEVGDFSTGSYLNDWPFWSTGSNRKASIVNVAEELSTGSGKALKLEADGSVGTEFALGTFSDHQKSLVPRDLEIIPGQSYTLSAEIYIAKGTKVHLVIGGDDYNVYEETRDKNSWKSIKITRTASDTFNETDFSIVGYSLTGEMVFYIKNVKFEMSDWNTGYSPYGLSSIYEKLIPDYLANVCYVNASSASRDYSLKANAPSQCYDYARRCNKDEVGCELYVSVSDSFAVPAQATNADYCPTECVGYDIYISRETHFNSPQAENLLPTTAQSCGAEAVGCSEFTNLDQLVQGGEQKEYYTSLKHCVKPGQSSCSNFYAWEGTSNGYQLRVYTLKLGNAGGPAVTADDSELCTAEIYGLSISDPGYNPDCREFYNQAGQIFYHLDSRTITCSDNCHAYRLSEKNVDRRLTVSECTGSDKHWETNSNSCSVCLNGGTWNSDHGACVYQAIPGEGKSCGFEDNGCREYNGNDGNNIKMLLRHDFENGANGWYSNCIGGVNVSSISNSKDGHSLLYNSAANNCAVLGEEGQAATTKINFIKKIFAANNTAAQLKVGTTVAQGKAYTIKFLAQAAENTDVEIYFYNKDTKEESFFSPLQISGGNDWQVYQVNLENLDHAVDISERLIIKADHNIYLDDFVLTEIVDRYYLIKGSTQIPDICYYDIFDNYQGADYNLGCSAYLDRNNVTHNFHQFSNICSETAVGCEQMIDTKNYDSYKPGLWNDLDDDGVCDANEPDCVKVDGDSAIYATYDVGKRCNSNDMGCSLVGQGQSQGTSMIWSDLFIKNNPNNYDRLLCAQADLGCEEWRNQNSNGFSYFKDPGGDVCSYRQGQDPLAVGKAWYKIPVKRCDFNGDGEIAGTEKTGDVCVNSSDCDDDDCVIDNNDYPCSVSYFKTVGLGGGGNQVPTPDQEAALCKAAASSCTEYIDPVSRFSSNMVYNAGFELINGVREGWGASSGVTWGGQSLASNQQVITLEQNKLYILSSESNSSTNVRLDFLKIVKKLSSDNTFSASVNFLEIPGNDNRIIFNSLSNTKARLTGGAVSRVIEVKEAVTSYQLQTGIDKKSCNGLVNFDNGCVLFNERTINGSEGLTSLYGGWDAYASQDGSAPVVCSASGDNCTANQLVKVRPDRVCAKWLDCITYVQDPQTQDRTCYAIGECDRLDDRNECSNFVDSDTTVLQFDAAENRNNSGYSLVDKYNLGQMEEVGLNSEVHYDFEDIVPPLSCERVEGGACSFVENIVKDLLVREPEGAPTDYPAHGKSYIKVPAAYKVSPHSKNINIILIGGRDYYINYLVNTNNSGLSAEVKIKDKDDNAFLPGAVWSESANGGWERRVHRFTTPTTSDGVNISIELGSVDTTNDGYVYFDDINIEPVLETAPNEYMTRECRLYPTSDSLTCFNKNDNVINDGLEGYCLEHDPDNTDVCLLWYPVDKINSAQTDRSSLGYQGRFPLSYCTEVDANFELLEKRKIVKNLARREECGNSDYCQVVATSCGGDTNYIMLKECDSNQSSNTDDWARYYCVPNSHKLKVSELSTMDGNVCGNLSFIWGGGIRYEIVDGWGDYNQFFYLPVTECSIDGNCATLDEAANANPPVRVYDYNYPPASEDGLKLLSGSNREDVYKLTCNRFAQVVESNGINKAWAGRVGVKSEWATTTPSFFVDQIGNAFSYYGAYQSFPSIHKIAAYGRNREEVPFGAAKWPDDFDLLSADAIPLQDQYSKKDKVEVFAGRPYGCSKKNGVGQPGCDNIGYCSLNPSVHCIYSDINSTSFNINQRTCADGGYGTCVPLWENYLTLQGDFYDFASILKTLFLKSYSSYMYNPLESFYELDPGGIYDFSENPLRPGQCQGNVRPIDAYITPPNNNSFCAVWPKIENTVLKYNDQIVGNINPFNVSNIGIYSLEFNTEINVEQQPLKSIYIDWGDGSQQMITGQDYRPSQNNPHIFYHFYTETGPKSIGITVWDNWGYWGSCSAGVCTLPPFN